MKLEISSPKERIDRSQYVLSRFLTHLDFESILDVGCYEAPLRDLLPGKKYFGIDIAGKPDEFVNLQETKILPIESSSYDIVICIEVLEHLDNLYSIFDELIRASSQYILVSLPNCWRDARVPLKRGHGSFAHYGLPSHPPKDRHRWFFNTRDAINFFNHKAEECKLNMLELVITEPYRNPAKRLVRHITHSDEQYMNKFAQTAWALFKK